MALTIGALWFGEKEFGSAEKGQFDHSLKRQLDWREASRWMQMVADGGG